MFNWAIIGAGNIANTVASEITKSGRHNVAAVYSRSQARAQAFAKKFDAKCFDNLEKMFADGGFDGVYIATPHSAHYKYVLECINHKIPVLCEKSFTVNSLQAKAALDAGEAAGVFVAEAMWTRFNPVTKQVQQWIKDGKIGEVTNFYGNFCLPLKVTKGFVSDRVYKPEYAGGALLDLGVYPVSYAQMLLGTPQKIIANQIIKNGVDMDDEITLIYSHASCALKCTFLRLETYTGVIIGSKGKIEIPMFYRPKKATLFIDGKKADTTKCKRGYIYQFDQIADDIRSGKTEDEFIPHKDTVEVMRIMDEIRRQNNFAYPEEIEKV